MFSRLNLLIVCLVLGICSPTWAQGIGGAESVTGINVSGNQYLIFTVNIDKRQHFDDRHIFLLIRKKWIRVRNYDEFGKADNKGLIQIWCDIRYDEVKDLLKLHNIDMGKAFYNREIQNGVKLRFAKLFENETPLGVVEQAQVQFIFVPQELLRK